FRIGMGEKADPSLELNSRKTVVSFFLAFSRRMRFRRPPGNGWSLSDIPPRQAWGPIGPAHAKATLNGESHGPTRTVRRRRPRQRNWRQARRLADGNSRTANCRRGTQMDRRRLSQHRLYAKQERDFERAGRPSRAPCRRIWLEARARRDRHGGGAQAQ